MSDQSLWANFVNGCVLLAGLFGLLLAVHWRDARKWWRSLGRVLDDARERVQ